MSLLKSIRKGLGLPPLTLRTVAKTALGPGLLGFPGTSIGGTSQMGVGVVKTLPRLPAPKTLPRLPTGPTLPRVPTIPRVGGIARGGKRGSLAARIAAGTVLVGAGGVLIDAFTGKPVRGPRRMNYANGRALGRAIRRMEGAARQYAKLLSATKGARCGGYTVKAKRQRRKCA